MLLNYAQCKKHEERHIADIYIYINYARWQYGGDKVAMKTIKKEKGANEVVASC